MNQPLVHSEGVSMGVVADITCSSCKVCFKLMHGLHWDESKGMLVPQKISRREVKCRLALRSNHSL